LTDTKYLVFKRDEFIDRHGTGKNVEALPDAVVIRLQDEFAEAGLSAYAMNIQTVLDVVEPEAIGTGVYRRLGEVRDYFLEKSHEAGDIRRQGESKLPD
jgi:hypothetical protein